MTKLIICILTRLACLAGLIFMGLLIFAGKTILDTDTAITIYSLSVASGVVLLTVLED